MFRFKKIKPFSKLNTKQKVFRILKFIGGTIVFFTLPTLLLFGVLYLKYNEPLPQGTEGTKADLLANKMLKALNYEAYKNTDYIAWTFKGIHHYEWQKTEGKCEVRWKDFKVNLDLNNTDNSKVFIANQEYNGTDKQKLVKKARDYFNNDSFWLVAPYKVFDQGTERKLIKTEDNNDALLVTYTSGGTTPGDSYLWHLHDNGMPKSYQMWVDILPINGLEATWEDWITTDSGAKLSKSHKLLVLNIEISNLSTKMLK